MWRREGRVYCECISIQQCTHMRAHEEVRGASLISPTKNQCVSFRLLNKSSMYGATYPVPRENFEVPKVSKISFQRE